MSASLTPSQHLFSAHPDSLLFPFVCSRMKHVFNTEMLCSLYLSSFPGANDVWFSLKGTTYQNNSNVTLEEIGEGDDALLCITNQTACCRCPYTGDMGPALGSWLFPNKTRVPSHGNRWDFFRARGQMVVRINRKRGGVNGIYRCVIPDAMNVTQTMYIGVCSAKTSEWSILF